MIMHRTLLNTCAGALVFGATFIAGVTAVADQVIPDDLIVQGSLCVGLDCVNNESFGFDTIRLKENNTRIKFQDTSTSAGFPSNDWQLTANDSASGGANKFSIEDITGAKVPFTVIAGAPTNSMFVASNGKVGFRTSTPVLDLHVTTSDTPAHRFEQTSAGGFTAQTWDVAGNEANFFVRDVTGGSRLPFRIRPGAPTSSLDIAASGNVGIGTTTPATKLTATSNQANTNDNYILTIENAGAPTAGMKAGLTFITGNGVAGAKLNAINDGASGADLTFLSRTNGTDTERVRILAANGNVGIGTTAPAAQFHTTGSVRLAGVASCASGIVSDGNGNLSCFVSSRQFKTIAGDLTPNVALANVMALRPQTGSYKQTPDVPEHWLIAEEVATVDPALIGLNDGKPYTVKTQNVVADLIVVVQQQQRRIEELERLLSRK